MSKLFKVDRSIFMIDTTTEEYQEEEVVDSKFVFSADDDTAFFKMDLGGDFSFNNNPNNGFGGYGGFTGPTSKPVFNTPAPAQTATPKVDPSTNCNKNCGSCIWSMFCKGATATLAGLGGAKGVGLLG